jgi:hypothetical protein
VPKQHQTAHDGFRFDSKLVGLMYRVASSARFPKFVPHRSTHLHELRKVMGYPQIYRI